MTDHYCAETGDNSSPSTGWDEARDTIVTCINSDSAAGDNIFLDSAYTHGATTDFTLGSSNSRIADPVVIISTDRTGDPEPPASGDFSAGALIDVSGSSASINLAGGLCFIGVNFDSNGYMAMRSQSVLRFEKCTFTLSNTAARFINAIEGTQLLEFIECDFDFRHIDDYIAVRGGCRMYFRDCSVLGTSAAITRFFRGSGAAGGWNITIDGFDFSNCASSGFEVLDDQSTTSNSLESFFDATGLVLPSGGVIGPTPSVSGLTYVARAVDSEYAHNRVTREGTSSGEETTVLSSNYDGTNKFSHKLVSTSQARLGVRPIELELGFRRYDANPTILVELTSDDTLTDQEFWIEVLYPEASNLGMFKRLSSRNADYFFGTGTTLTTSAEAWTSAKTNKYSVSLTISGGAAGVHRVYAALAPGSAKTVYVDGAPLFS